MGFSNSLSFTLIGENTLLLNCAEFILRQGFGLTAVISSSRDIEEWAIQNNIKIFSSLTEDAVSFLSNCPFDYLLSIDNENILDKKILSLPKRFSVNYHDSLLPKYAGLNSTTWAILNKEKEHGITWHKIDEGIDTGDILSQVSFPILPEDTSLSLNLKCYERAIETFPSLLNKLQENSPVLIKQRLSDRSYFGAREKIYNNGFLDLSKPAEYLTRLSRALHFGPYPNNLVSLKIYLNGRIFLVKSLTLCQEKLSNKFGVLTRVSKGYLQISTLTFDIRIEIADLMNNDIKHDEISIQTGIRPGDRIDQLDKKSLLRYDAQHEKYKIHEKKWLKHLKECKNTSLPIFFSYKKNKEIIPVSSYSFHYDSDVFITFLLISLFKVQEYRPFSAWLCDESRYRRTEYLKGLCLSEYPITIDESFCDKTCDEAHNAILEKRSFFEEKPPLEKEIFSRNCISTAPLETRTILIYIRENETIPDFIREYDIVFIISKNNSEVATFINPELAMGKTELNLIKKIPDFSKSSINEYTTMNPLIRSLQMITCREKNNILDKFCTSKELDIPSENVYEHIKKYSTLQKIAIITHESKYSYPTLIADVESLSLEIRKHKACRSRPILTFFDRSYELFVSILASLNEGSPYVPLDLQWPEFRINHILSHSGADLILSKSDAVMPIFGTLQSKIIPLLSVNKQVTLRIAKTTVPSPKISRDTSYIIYTSGTTGLPKAVMVSDTNIKNYFYWFKEEFNLTASSIVDFSTSMAFDISIPCTIGPLMAGATVAVCPETHKSDPKKYLNHLQINKVTHVECTPGYLNKILNYPNLVSNLDCLEYLLLGAEKLIKKDVVRWLSLCPKGHKLINEYGPTECTVAASQYKISKEALKSCYDGIPIGRPAYNNAFLILDKFGNICPAGIPGELFITGLSVSLGYLSANDKQNKSFSVEPITPFYDKYKNCYATGDIVRWLDDGNIDYIDRKDRQVKVMGYRVELDSINSALLNYPDIIQCHVTTRLKNEVNTSILAYIRTENNKPIESVSINQYLKTRLPSYMIPSRYLFVSKIPLSPTNEKVDEKKLDNYIIHSLVEHSPSDKLDNILSLESLISSILNVDDFNENTELFDLGLDSLASLELISLIKCHLKIELSLIDILENNTLSKLSKYIYNIEKTNRLRKESLSSVVLKKSGDHSPLFLIHPLGGGVFWYKSLVKHVSPSLPLIALQDPSLELPGSFLFNTIQEMASFYVNVILSHQPDGPYYIAGASFGATLALEVAQQLKAKKRKIAFVGMFDGWASYDNIDVSYIKKSNLSDLDKYSKTYGQDDGFNLNWHTSLQEQRSSMLSAYEIQRYNLPITLFKATQRSPGFENISDPFNGWKNHILAEIKVLYIEGSHSSMFIEPNVTQLGKALNNSIKESSLEEVVS